MFSFWEHSAFLDRIDVVVLGAGIVGMNAALSLRERYPDARVVILERGFLPTGASTKNAGFACFGSASELLDNLQTEPLDKVLELVALRYEGLTRLRARTGEKQIGFIQNGNYELFTHTDMHSFEACVQALPQLNQYLAPITKQAQTFEIQPEKIQTFGLTGVEQLIWNKSEGELHTGKLIRRLQALCAEQKIEIWNGVEVAHIEDAGVGVSLRLNDASKSELKAQKLLVCTNAFAKQLLPNLDVIPARNQVIVTEPIPNFKLQGCFHYDKGYVYFRNIEGRLLIGGARNLDFEAETSWDFALTEPIQTRLETIISTHILADQPFPKIDYRWAGIMGMGAEKRPIVEKISKHIAVAVRMSGMGVAIGALVGEMGAKLL